MKIAHLLKISLMISACLPVSNLCYAAEANAAVAASSTTQNTQLLLKKLKDLASANPTIPELTTIHKN